MGIADAVAVEAFRAEECGASDLDSWCRLSAQGRAASSGGAAGPGEPAARLRAGDGERVRRWVARSAGRICAVAEVRPQPHDPQVGFLRLFVAAGARRRGIGSRLLERVVAEAGMRRLQATVPAGAPGEPFARGWQVLLRLELHEQRLDRRVLRRCRDLAAAAPPAYRVRLWQGAAPPELVSSFGRVMGHVMDAPGAALQMAPRTREAGAVRAWEAGMDGHLLVCAAVPASSGEVAGATVATVPDAEATVADQHDTAVAPGHRGRGLARWMKAHQALRLHRLFPRAESVAVTVNRANTPMLAVNRALGYRFVRERLLIEGPAEAPGG